MPASLHTPPLHAPRRPVHLHPALLPVANIEDIRHSFWSQEMKACRMVSISDLFTSSWYDGNAQPAYHPHTLYTLYISGKRNEKAPSFADTKSLFLDMNRQDVAYQCHGKAVGKSLHEDEECSSSSWSPPLFCLLCLLYFWWCLGP